MIRKAQKVEKLTVEKARGGKGDMLTSVLLLEDEFCNKGRMFNHSVLKPGCSVGYHGHEGDFEAYYILKGAGSYNDNGVERPVSAGDVTLCKDGESHGLENTGTEDLEFIALILYSK